MTPKEVVESYFAAMRGGLASVEDLIALFADDAVYTEPFTGEVRTHKGVEAIATCLRQSLENPPPDMTLDVRRVDVDGGVVRSEWTCTSPVFPHPMQGVDTCTVAGGRIQSLEVHFE